MTLKIENNVEEFSGGLLAVITSYAISEVALYAAVSGIVGALVAHYAKKLFKLIDEKIKSFIK